MLLPNPLYGCSQELCNNLVFGWLLILFKFFFFWKDDNPQPYTLQKATITTIG
jgi:hypothetical protein